MIHVGRYFVCEGFNFSLEWRYSLRGWHCGHRATLKTICRMQLFSRFRIFIGKLYSLQNCSPNQPTPWGKAWEKPADNTDCREKELTHPPTMAGSGTVEDFRRTVQFVSSLNQKIWCPACRRRRRSFQDTEYFSGNYIVSVRIYTNNMEVKITGPTHTQKPPKTKFGCLHGGIIENGLTRNLLSRTVPVYVQVCAHRVWPSECSAEDRYNNSNKNIINITKHTTTPLYAHVPHHTIDTVPTFTHSCMQPCPLSTL